MHRGRFVSAKVQQLLGLEDEGNGGKSTLENSPKYSGNGEGTLRSGLDFSGRWTSTLLPFCPISNVLFSTVRFLQPAPHTACGLFVLRLHS